MIDSITKYYKNNLDDAVFINLLRYIPPDIDDTTHLEDIVNILMDSLSIGETEVNIKEYIPTRDLKGGGWPENHIRSLLQSGWTSGNNPPIVKVGEKISWNKWYYEMHKIIAELKARSLLDIKFISQAMSKESIFSGDIEQLKAIEAIKSQMIILLSGGPGTGKTSTVIKMLHNALCINPSLKVGLAAPTGKATMRLKESLQNNLTRNNSKATKGLKDIPCNTLHKWLQANQERFQKNRSNPLNLDILVVDEMSMVDLQLMKGLLEALPKETQLILVGDPNQLSPVNSGAIWDKLQQPDIKINFKGSIHLQKTYRNRGEIAALSKILCNEGIDMFWEKIHNISTSANIQLHKSNANNVPQFLLARIQTHFSKLSRLATHISLNNMGERDLLDKSLEVWNQTALDLLLHLDRLMVLCPKRNGNWGVNSIHKSIMGNNFMEDSMNWVSGTPVICGQNQPELGLANGDIGVVIGEAKTSRFLFKDQADLIQIIHPSRLSIVEPAFALTIHKSQGCEAEEVILLWPEEDSKSSLLQTKKCSNSRHEQRLLYTAITRAKKKVDLLIYQNT